MKRTLLLITASLALVVAPVRAAVLTLDYSGSFDAASTLNGTPFGADTPFFIQAAFDPAANFFVGPPIAGEFAITAFSIQLPSGTYTASPALDLNVLLINNGGAWYAAGLVDHTGVGGQSFASMFATASPTFSANAPTPSVLSGYMANAGGFPYTITLDGGAGDLVVDDLGSGPFSAELSGELTGTATPEPSQWAMMGVTLLGLGGLFVRHRRPKVNSTRQP